MAGVAAVLLAAGESSRMGAPKPLLPWGARSLVRYQVNALVDAGAFPVIVVLGRGAVDVAPHVDGLPGVLSVVNARYREGKATSVRAGVALVPADADAILLLAVDQPRSAAIHRQVLAAHLASGALITHPAYQGRGGHPIVFDASLATELLAVTEERQGIREVVGRRLDALHTVELDDPMVRLDLNTQAEYEAAAARYAPWP